MPKRTRRRKPFSQRKPPKTKPSKGFPLSTLCWCCAKATTEGCSWSANFIPVKGWEATPTIIKEGALLNEEPRLTHSFKVHKCPEVVEDCEPQKLGLVRNKIN